METITRSDTLPETPIELVLYWTAPATRDSHDQMLRELMETGMSEETALEQITRLTAGDIWCG